MIVHTHINLTLLSLLIGVPLGPMYRTNTMPADASLLFGRMFPAQTRWSTGRVRLHRDRSSWESALSAKARTLGQLFLLALYLW